TRCGRGAAGRAPPGVAPDEERRPPASRAMEDTRDARRVIALALEGNADRLDRRGERQDVARDQEVVVVGADRVPVDAARGDGHLRYEIGAREGDAVLG